MEFVPSTQGERLLLEGLRTITECPDESPRLRWRFDILLGPMAGSALAALSVFVWRVRREGQRRLVLSSVVSGNYTQDEELILAIFGTAQSGQYAKMETYLERLLARRPEAFFSSAVCLVADAFQLNGMVLNIPDIERCDYGAPDACSSACLSDSRAWL